MVIVAGFAFAIAAIFMSVCKKLLEQCLIDALKKCMFETF